MVQKIDPYDTLRLINQRGQRASNFTASLAAGKRIKKEQEEKAARDKQLQDYLSNIQMPGGGTSGYRAPAGRNVGGAVVGRSSRNTTNPALLRIAPGSNLVTINTKAGKVTVNKNAANAFSGFLNELVGQGYKVNSLGGYANRQNVNNPSKKSHHAYGYAIDINPATNPNRSSRTDMPANIQALIKKYGLGWGGNWSGTKDPMHFEYLGY